MLAAYRAPLTNSKNHSCHMKILKEARIPMRFPTTTACLTLLLALASTSCSGDPSDPNDGTGGLDAASGGQQNQGSGGESTTPGSGGNDSGVGSGGLSGDGGSPSGGTSGSGGLAGTGGTGSGTADACSASNPNAHFVNSAGGDDANSGNAPEQAWKSLDRVNAETFEPGDSLCFATDGNWEGQLAPQGSGSDGSPIVVAQYGEGARPHIAAGAGDLQALLLRNVEYWEVNDLEFTNDKQSPGDFRGISVRAKDVGALNHIHIKNTYVHDVTGHVYWIGGNTSGDKAPWIKFQTGWDASKRTGGIVFEVESDQGIKSWFNDVLIEGNVVSDTSFGGIIFKQFDGGYGWGVRNSTSDSKFTPHTNVVIRDNYVSQTNTPYGCNTIYVTGAQHVMIEGNVCEDSGTSAIEAYNSDDVVIQHNEAFGTVQKAGGADSNGIDADRATTNTIIQYNYVHDNGDGILLCQILFGDVIVRYNLLVNNKRWGINLHSDKSARNVTYNNLFYISGLNSGDLVGSSGGSSFLNSGGYALSNNIFHSSRSSRVDTGSAVTYKNNLFSGVTATGSGAVTGSPGFVDPSKVPSGDTSGPVLDALDGFKVSATSVAVGKGTSISDNGGKDFWGEMLYQGQPDIGPGEQ